MDEEWAEVAPLIPPAKPGGNKRTVNICEVLNGIMYLLGTVCQWRDIPKDLPPKNTVHDYLDRWDYDGTLELIHHKLYIKCREQAGREASPTVAVIDSRSVKSADLGRDERAKGKPASIRMVMTRGRKSKAKVAHPRRYDGPVDARRRACGRYTGPRWRCDVDGHAVWSVPVPFGTLR